MLGSAVRGVKLMVALQIVSRVFTFGLNTLVLRRVSPALVGAASQLHLLVSLALFFSREAVRRALARSDGSSLLAWLPLPLGLVSCFFLGFAWLSWSSSAERALSGWTVAVLGTLAAAMIELAAEPAFSANLRALRYRARFVIESAAVLAMCGTLYVAAVQMNMGLPAWAIGQTAYAIVFLAGNVIAANRGAKEEKTMKEDGEKKEKVEKSSNVDWRLLAAFQWQATQQLVLQEGERVMLKVSSASLTDQGTYSVVANLGSLLVRSLFLPFEDVAGTYFSRLLKDGDHRQQAGSVLRVVTHFLVTVSLFMLSFGPALSFFALDLLYGSRLSESNAPEVLRAYCGYVSLLGLNGVTEAFVRAAISPSQQYRLNLLLILFSIIHVVSCIVLLGSSLGSVGLVYANSLGMILRLSYSVVFIRSYLPFFSWRAVFPPLPVLMAFAVAAFGLPLISADWCHSSVLSTPSCWSLAALAGVFFVAACGSIYLFDRSFLAELRALWSGKKTQ